MEVKRQSNGLQNSPYEKPLIELVKVLSEEVMEPVSWNDGQGGPNISIIQGAPDDSDDGKGAKGNVIWVNDHANGSGLWDD
ncbi:MAG: hypothetical protein IJV36_01600 [Prevotella sp.]|nr:hypothetical protein [Prevotella sp.]